MTGRRSVALALVLLLLGAPLARPQSTTGDPPYESRVGVALMVVCGLSLKAAIPAPVPWSGIALLSCVMGLLDAALSPDP